MSAPPPPTAGPRRMTRSNRSKVIAGVCGGISESLDVNPTLIRILYSAVTILTGIVPGLLAYIILMFVLPRPDSVA